MELLPNNRDLKIRQRDMVSVVAYPGVVDIYPDEYVVIAKYFDLADAMKTVYDMNNSTPEGQYRAFIVDTDGEIIGFSRQAEADQGVDVYDVPLVC